MNNRFFLHLIYFYHKGHTHYSKLLYIYSKTMAVVMENTHCFYLGNF